jgi:hypothetical protein
MGYQNDDQPPDYRTAAAPLVLDAHIPGGRIIGQQVPTRSSLTSLGLRRQLTAQEVARRVDSTAETTVDTGRLIQTATT